MHHPSRLTVLAKIYRIKNGKKLAFYRCACSCGKVKEIYKGSVDMGLTRSCGCLHRQMASLSGIASRKHGDSTCGGKRHEAPEYNTWRAMLKRCHSPGTHNYPYYGAVGVSVWPEWRSSYVAFLGYVGRKPSPIHSLDRYPNGSGNYEPGNVRWATPIEQGRNRKNNRTLEVDGTTKVASEWAEQVGVSRRLIYDRLKLGWTAKQAIFSPLRKRLAPDEPDEPRKLYE